MDRSSSPARILTIAGSDSGGGAGIQADIKTIAAFGGYAATAVTALTAQNTQGVQDVLPCPPAFIAAQIRCVIEDIGVDAMKTGMLLDECTIDTVLRTIDVLAPGIPLVVDPVMVATSGDRLLEEEAIGILRTRLLPRATLITPNIPEAAWLTGMSINSPEEAETAAQALLDVGAGAVLLTGGHLQEDAAEVCDVLATPDGARQWFCSPRIRTRHTHGTGCTLSAAIATRLGQGAPLADAIQDARAYLADAIRHAPGFGRGHGPVWHAATYPNGAPSPSTYVVKH